jgi:hypothetical protein
MKIVSAIIMVGVSLSAFGQTDIPNQTEAAPPPFKLEITANLDKAHTEIWDFANCGQTVVNFGSMVVVAVRKTNITDHEIPKRTHAGESYGYRYEVHDSAGNLLHHKNPNEVKMIGGDEGGHELQNRDVVLQPGESKIDHDRISDGYDMSQPGTYTIQVSAHTSNDPKSEVVKSNIITVTVLPKPESDDPK